MKKKLIFYLIIYVSFNLFIVVPYKLFKLELPFHTIGKVLGYNSYSVHKGSVFYPIVSIKKEQDTFIIDNPKFATALFAYKGQEVDVYYKINNYIKHYYLDESGNIIYLESNYSDETCQKIIESNIYNIQEEKHTEIDNDTVVVNSFFWLWLPINEIIIHALVLLIIFGLFNYSVKKEVN